MSFMGYVGVGFRQCKAGWAAFAALGALLGAAVSSLPASDTFQSFDIDPSWDGLRNRTVPNPGPTVTQDFGFSSSSYAGGALGELGGSIARTTTPAWYADVISIPKTFNDVLTASGKVSMP